MRTRTRWLIAGTTAALLVGMLTQVDAGGILLKKEDIPKAIVRLKTGSPKEKAAAAEALGERGAVRLSDVKEAIGPLKETFEKDADPKVRAAAGKALGRIAADGKATAQLLLKALKNEKEDPEVRKAAMIGLGSLGPDGRVGMAEMRKLVQDKDDKMKLKGTAQMVLRAMQNK